MAETAITERTSSGGTSARPAVTEESRSIAPVLPAVLAIYLFLLFPIETRPEIFNASLPIYRIAVLIFAPLMLLNLGGRKTRFIFADWLLVLAAGWILISFTHHFGFGDGLFRASGVLIDLAGGYALGRMAIRDARDLRIMLILISPGLLLAGLEMMIESISGRLIVRPFFQSIFGIPRAYEQGEAAGAIILTEQTRLGILRAYGPFSHPILGGAILVSMFPLYYMSGIRSWPRWIGIAASACGLFSVSSAAFLGLLIGALLITIDRGMRYLAKVGWPIIVTLILLVLLFVEVASNSGIVGLISRVSLDPETAGYRVLIWEYGTESVANYPFLGIGYDDWERPGFMHSGSIDAHWLALAVRNGLPLPFLLILIIVAGMIGCALRAGRSGVHDRNLLVALNLTMGVLLVIAMTVYFFGEANVWFMIFIGICGSMTAGLRISTLGQVALDENQKG